MWTVLLSLACAPAAPTTASDCRFVLDSAKKSECMSRVATTLFASDPQAGLAFIESEIAEPIQRDFILLQVVQDIPTADPRLCKKIESASLRASCDTAAQRPHLKSPEGGGPRGAPPAPLPPR